MGVIHKYRPDLIADPASLDPSNAAENCELAFSVAEEKLGISRLLDVEDVAGNARPDDKSIATYMNEFYLLFASQMQADNQIEAIIKACAVTRRHDDLIAKHSKDAAEIKAFLAEKSAFYADFSYGGSTDSIREQLMAFYEYRNATKPPMAGHIIECGGTLNSLRSSCKANMRPIYEPHAEFQPDVIEAGWSELESVENDHEIKLRDFYRKFQEVDFAAKKFSVRADKFDRWAQEKSVVFEEADFGTGTVGAEICQNSFEIYEGQLAKFKQAASEMEEAATTCEAVPEHESSASVVDRNKLCQQKLSELESAGIAYKAALDKKLELEIRKAELKKTVAKDGAIALYDAENLEETIMEPIVAGQVAAIQEKIDELEGPIAAEVEDLVSVIRLFVHLRFAPTPFLPVARTPHRHTGILLTDRLSTLLCHLCYTTERSYCEPAKKHE